MSNLESPSSIRTETNPTRSYSKEPMPTNPLSSLLSQKDHISTIQKPNVLSPKLTVVGPSTTQQKQESKAFVSESTKPSLSDNPDSDINAKTVTTSQLFGLTEETIDNDDGIKVSSQNKGAEVYSCEKEVRLPARDIFFHTEVKIGRFVSSDAKNESESVEKSGKDTKDVIVHVCSDTAKVRSEDMNVCIDNVGGIPDGIVLNFVSDIINKKVIERESGKVSMEAQKKSGGFKKKLVEKEMKQRKCGETEYVNKGPSFEEHCLDIVPLSSIVIPLEGCPARESGASKSSRKGNITKSKHITKKKIISQPSKKPFTIKLETQTQSGSTFRTDKEKSPKSRRRFVRPRDKEEVVNVVETQGKEEEESPWERKCSKKKVKLRSEKDTAELHKSQNISKSPKKRKDVELRKQVHPKGKRWDSRRDLVLHDREH
ncbi:uncharacterized protein LOC132639873 [Lycium barbarum]|uniref:uncharacterized protein LOC132639873 n=1 Tax=Lycium barbarum TaxID=112863 RepID=UPI00293EC78B|nr:uncharacterized protein LOC132639873 [Lycium barbarum]